MGAKRQFWVNLSVGFIVPSASGSRSEIGIGESAFEFMPVLSIATTISMGKLDS